MEPLHDTCTFSLLGPHLVLNNQFRQWTHHPTAYQVTFGFYAPSLEHLKIDQELVDSQDLSLQVWHLVTHIFTSGTPLLSSIVLKGIRLQCCNAPLDAVTLLLLDSNDDGTMLMPYDYFCNALNACSSLTWLELRGWLFSTFGSNRYTKCVHQWSLFTTTILNIFLLQCAKHLFNTSIRQFRKSL